MVEFRLVIDYRRFTCNIGLRDLSRIFTTPFTTALQRILTTMMNNGFTSYVDLQWIYELRVTLWIYKLWDFLPKSLLNVLPATFAHSGPYGIVIVL